MIQLKLKDGSIREVEKNTAAAEAVKNIGMGLYKAACCVKLNGQVKDLRSPITEDADFEVCTFDTKEGKEVFWHTASHLLAMAVKELYPEAKLARGPATEDGFYYDFQVATPFTQGDLAKIEEKMKSLAKEGFPLERKVTDEAEAKNLMAGEPLKLELIEKHQGEELSFYSQGNFIDLCAGPHLMNVSVIKAVKLLSCTGAYWGKAEEGRQLSRIYGTAFPKASELEAHLKAVEEARQNDHNKIGRELEYFTTVDIIGQGLPVILPKGAKVIQVMQRFVEDEEARRGYLLTKTPYMAKSDLYKLSGHWDHYKEGMFVMGDEEKGEAYALRPMTCPFQYQVFLNRQRSYRDLPMRLGETSTLFRNEDSGEMHGLIRVRQFTISEGHLMCTKEQLAEEFKGCVKLSKDMLTAVGLAEDITFRFSQWDPNNREKYVGTDEQWEESQSMMKSILDELGIQYSIGVGEAAFYGPKLDLQIKNVYGKEDTLVTVQIDEMLAEKFDMEYVASDGTKKRPCIIHRTSLGCYERTLALLLEKYAGALPAWLAPVQAMLIPITPRAEEHILKVKAALEAKGLRVDADFRSESLGYKLRAAQLEKIPFMLVAGDNEVNDGSISIRSRAEGDLGAIKIEEAVEKIIQLTAQPKFF